jgi:addiction module HigA family antidote
MKLRKPSHSGELLQRPYVDEMKLMQKQPAEKIRCRHAQVNLIINGRRGISPELALQSERLLKVDAKTRLSPQTKYDLWEARQH